MIKLIAKNYNEVIRRRQNWPKYSTQLMNLAAQNCKALSPKNIGSVKEMWVQMRSAGIRGTLENWTNFYNQHRGEKTIEQSGKKLHDMLLNMQIRHISLEMSIEYVKEVVYNKTHMGLGGEEIAVQVVAHHLKLPYRFSSQKEESMGIDAWVGSFPVQVKPHDTAFKSHIHNHPVRETVLLVTYEPKKPICYIHNVEFMNHYRF